MNVLKRGVDTLELCLTTKELGGIGQSLNECCNGFGVKDFEATIGAGEKVLQAMLDQIGLMYRAPIGHEG